MTRREASPADAGRCFIGAGENLDAQLDRAVEAGRCLPEEADTIREFRDFLRESGPRGVPTPPEVMRRHREFLGLSEVEVDDYERRYRARHGAQG